MLPSQGRGRLRAMKFFIPGAEDAEKAEEVWEATRKFAKETMGWEIGAARIRSMTYKDQGKVVQAIVGQPAPRHGEAVIAILESNTYLVCTPSRGVLRGMPIMVGKHEVLQLEQFEP
jgi:hypothetical protein